MAGAASPTMGPTYTLSIPQPDVGLNLLSVFDSDSVQDVDGIRSLLLHGDGVRLVAARKRDGYFVFCGCLLAKNRCGKAVAELRPERAIFAGIPVTSLR